MRLYQRSNGYWYVEFERGKAKSLRTKDKKEALRLFKEIQREVLKGKLLLLEKQNHIKLSEFIQEYLQYSETRKASTTAQRDKYALKRFLETVGDKPLRLITSKDIETFFSVMLSKNRKPQGINIEYRHIKAAFSKAVEWGYLKTNPCFRVKPLKEPKAPPRFLSYEEAKQVLSYLKEQDRTFYFLVRFALETGARRIEIHRLHWQDILWTKNLIKLYGKGDKVRYIPLTSSLKELFKEYGIKDFGKVFPYQDIGTITHKWEKSMKALKMNYRFHDLRHTTASWLVMNGAPLKVVQELLGHSQISVTQIYAHLKLDVLKEILESTFAVNLQT